MSSLFALLKNTDALKDGVNRAVSFTKDAVTARTSSATASKHNLTEMDKPFNPVAQDSYSSTSEFAQDLDPVLQHLVARARSSSVTEQFLRIPEEDYLETHDVKLLCCTYNVNGRKPPEDVDLTPWLQVQHDPDIVAISLQEVVPLDARNVVMGATVEGAAKWDRLLSSTLNCKSQDTANFTKAIRVDGDEGHTIASPAALDELAHKQNEEYIQVASKQMVGLYLTIWAKRSIVPFIRGVQATTVATGMLGYFGNKGCVSIRMRVYDTGVAFVCAHLSSGESEGDDLKRNYDYTEIIRRLQFPPDTEIAQMQQNPNAGYQQMPGITKVAELVKVRGNWASNRLLDHDAVVWMGDLNYRIGLSDAEVRLAVRNKSFDRLIDSEELTVMRRAGRAFGGWMEGRITFAPTFKIKRGTLQYLGDDDDSVSVSGSSTSDFATLNDPAVMENFIKSSNAMSTSDSPAGKQAVEKTRKPAWTDRILFRGSSPNNIQQLMYSSADLTISDHLPVFSVFQITVREYVRERVEAAIDAARRIADALEMSSIPHCELDPAVVDCGVVYYCRRKDISLVLRNTSSSVANFQFMPLPAAMFGDRGSHETRVAPKWAAVEPEGGVLEAEGSIDLNVSIMVQGGPSGSAEAIVGENNGQLEAILVLRIQNGNDIFLTITGKYLPSCFGISLQVLNSLPRPLIAQGDTGEDPIPLRSSAFGATTIKTPPRIKAKCAEPSELGNIADFYSPTSSLADSPGTVLSPDERQTREVEGQPEAESLGDAECHVLPTSTCTVSGDGDDDGHAQQSLGVGPASTSTAYAQVPLPLRRKDSPSIIQLVPVELRNLTDYLLADDNLHTPGLFVSSADCAMAYCADPSNLRHRSTMAISAIRFALDRGLTIPAEATVHDVTATLLAFFVSLPSSFMPNAVAQFCDICAPTVTAASSLLADVMSPVEWAVFRHIISLMQEALQPSVRASNGLTESALAALLAEVWFPVMPQSFTIKGDLKPENVSDIQRMAEDISAISVRRSEFIAVFLAPENESS